MEKVAAKFNKLHRPLHFRGSCLHPQSLEQKQIPRCARNDDLEALFSNLLSELSAAWN
jgi:hypothetical protein